MKRLNDAAEHLLANIDRLADDFNGTDGYWKYYRSISGWVNNKYLNVYFMHGSSDPVVKISFTTDCKEEVREILKEWSDLIVEY